MVSGPELDRARETAETALRHMAVLGIPPTPENYAVWFAYAAGSDPHLRRTIDILMDNGQEFDDLRNAELHARFVLPTYRTSAVDTVADDLHAVAGQLSTTVGHAGAGVRRYGDALSNVSGALHRTGADGTGADDTGVRSLVTGLMQETREMEANNARLRERLEQSSSEIARLRETLEETRREASTDGLTGIANRMRFERELRMAAAAAMEDGTTLCLLMADIDHFKVFNDTHGHSVGDQVLRLVARVLSEAVRPGDLVARYGGEEFTVILPDCNLDEAARIAERIRDRIGHRHVVRRSTGDDLGAVTLSLGATAYRFGEPIAQAVERADAALYRAKQAGRNRVEVDGDLSAAAAN
ncbi:GGDEF domain-containing protein [Thalassobaculum fulvum]|uniref:diguanylate cyclase n=1 Tax=Thalassobaculum fulvum TaxID=1633335 RepID=A0A918XUE5_9PROT|nr:GGDEF domain-containing protein [Thalassobaculum fulvum]GHD54412.1 GGDEF domain-containing protein [Thalassobaculum fulvum]